MGRGEIGLFDCSTAFRLCGREGGLELNYRIFFGGACKGWGWAGRLSLVHDDVAKVLIDEEVIEKRLDVVAEKIMEDFGGRDFVAIVILKGALVFTADLLRRMPVPLEIETLNVASYHGGTESSGQVDFLDHKLPVVEGKRVLVIDDILDTGRTLVAVKKKLEEQGAALVRSCVLLSKDKARAAEVEADYTGFVIGDEFVVGYGLDYRGHYRNLPYVGVLKEECINVES